MNVVFFQRNFGGRLTSPLQFTVVRYSHSVMGGPKAAEIRATGGEELLGELLDRLRCGVEIYDDTGDCVWWGYADEVVLSIDALQVGLRLSEMANKIAIAYAYIPPGHDSAGERRTTAWQEDIESVREFGIKELLLTLSRATDSQAAQRRASELALCKSPANVPQVTGMGAKRMEAKIICRGWWETLGWRYASVPTRLALAFDTIGTTDVTVGKDEGAGTIKSFAQSFDVMANFNLQEIEIYAAKVGLPDDSLKVAIFTNPDDLTPTTELANQSKDAVNISGLDWYRFTLSAPLALESGKTYFLVVERTGAAVADKYYQLRLDEMQGYGAGILRKKTGSSWGSGPAADMPFRLYANDQINTAVQIQSLITNFGQFLRRVEVSDVGIVQESYRDGDATALYEVEEMMDTGTPNGRRLLAKVDQARRVQIFEEPTPVQPYSLMRNGDLKDPFGNPIRKTTCPVGVWVKLNDLFANSGVRRISDPTLFFVDETEYDVSRNALSLRPRNIDDPYSGRVTSG